MKLIQAHELCALTPYKNDLNHALGWFGLLQFIQAIGLLLTTYLGQAHQACRPGGGGTDSIAKPKGLQRLPIRGILYIGSIL